MHDILTLLATATDDRLERFAIRVGFLFAERRKQTTIFSTSEDTLPFIIEAAIGCAVTLQQVIEPGRAETYKLLHQGPMEGWGNHLKA